MTFDEFKPIAKMFKATYGNLHFLEDSESVIVWYRLLSDLTKQDVEQAVMQYVTTQKYPPSISDIREKAAHFSKKDWGEGWIEVTTAINKYGTWDEKSAMQSFSPETRKAVEAIGWKNICMSENIGVERASFRQIYEGISKQEKEEAVLPQLLKQNLKMIGDKT